MLNSSSEIKYVLKIAMSVAVSSALVLPLSCSSNELELKSNAQVVRTPIVKVGDSPHAEDGLEQRAIRLTELYDEKNCKEFFYAFPDTIKEFDQLYGYDNEKDVALRLLSKSEQHISFFFDCSEVSDRLKLEKVIRIGIYGKWDPSYSTGVFPHAAFDFIKNYPSEVKKILDRLPDEKAASFWYFLLDKPHPGDSQIVKDIHILVEKLGKDSKQAKLLSEQHKKLVADWKEH